jgi:hypothetical protein
MYELMRTRIDASDPDDEEPEDLAAWLVAGFEVPSAEVWRRWRFSIAQAKTWQSAGVHEGLHAAQWSTAGVQPATVEAWRAAGINAAEAVRWHEFGYGLEAARAERQKGNGPDAAFASSHVQTTASLNVVRSARGAFASPIRRLRDAGVEPRIMQSYMQHQWIDDDAVEWAKHGIEANDAYTWHELGLTAAEAGRFQVLGRTPGQVIAEWWTAGIPFQEAAEWIGAGLSADEAAEQRARGITAEHAASLRALRQGEPPVDRTGPRGSFRLARLGPPGSEQPGPPPADQGSARAEIEQAFAGMLTGDADSHDVPTVDGGENLGDCLRDAAQRHGVIAEQSGATVRADFVQFVNDHEARVSYSVVISGMRNMQFGDRPGRAVLIDGTWKVARDTFCQFMQMAGVECPPRSPGP